MPALTVPHARINHSRAVRAMRLKGQGNIIGTGLLRTFLIRRGDGPARFHSIVARRSARRRRALLLAPLLAALFVALVGQNREAISKISREKILTALQDPLSLFSDRSPGER